MRLIEPQWFRRHNFAQQCAVVRHRLRIVAHMSGEVKRIKRRKAHAFLSLNLCDAGGGQGVDVGWACPVGGNDVF